MGFKPKVNESCLHMMIQIVFGYYFALFVDDLIICSVMKAIADVKHPFYSRQK